MSAFSPQTFEEAKLAFKPLRRSPMSRTALEGGKSLLVADKARERASLKPARPLKRRRPIKSSAIPYGTNSVSRKKKAALRQKADPKLVAWGRAVKKRDGNKCKWPGLGYDVVLAMPVNTIVRTQLVVSPCVTGDTRIDPHHIAPRGRRPDLKYVVANGIALCRTHHDWVGDHPIEAEVIGLLSSETYEKARKRT